MNNTIKASFAGIIYQTEKEVNGRNKPNRRHYTLVSIKRTALMMPKNNYSMLAHVGFGVE